MEFLVLTNIGLYKSQMKSIAPVNEVVRGQPININHSDSNPECYTKIMAIRVVEFSSGGYKIRKIFA